MATENSKVSKVVGSVKEFLPSTKKQIIGSSVISVGVGALSFVVGRLTKGAKKPAKKD